MPNQTSPASFGRSVMASPWAKTLLLILGIVALIVVGPKDLPILLRTIGKYMGMIRRQANEFKSQFDDAMRESELQNLKQEVENVGRDMQNTMREAETSIDRDMRSVDSDIEKALQAPVSPENLPLPEINPPPEPVTSTASIETPPPAKTGA